MFDLGWQELLVIGTVTLIVVGPKDLTKLQNKAGKILGKIKYISREFYDAFNKIDFVALNQGASGPNTAEVRVFDDNGKLVGSNRWNLATGVKATYIIVKEK